MKFIIKKKQKQPVVFYALEIGDLDKKGEIQYDIPECYIFDKLYDANKKYCNLKLFGHHSLINLISMEKDSDGNGTEMETIDCWDRNSE